MAELKRLLISADNLERILDHVRQGEPSEVCGLIGGQNGLAQVVTAVPNASRTPRTAYEMERQAMVDAVIRFQRARLEVVAIYHSHPNSSAEPSPTDVQQATWPDSVYLIIGKTVDPQTFEGFDIRAWTIHSGRVEPADLEIVAADQG